MSPASGATASERAPSASVIGARTFLEDGLKQVVVIYVDALGNGGTRDERLIFGAERQRRCRRGWQATSSWRDAPATGRAIALFIGAGRRHR